MRQRAADGFRGTWGSEIDEASGGDGHTVVNKRAGAPDIDGRSVRSRNEHRRPACPGISRLFSGAHSDGSALHSRIKKRRIVVKIARLRSGDQRRFTLKWNGRRGPRSRRHLAVSTPPCIVNPRPLPVWCNHHHPAPRAPWRPSVEYLHPHPPPPGSTLCLWLFCETMRGQPPLTTRHAPHVVVGMGDRASWDAGVLQATHVSRLAAPAGSSQRAGMNDVVGPAPTDAPARSRGPASVRPMAPALNSKSNEMGPSGGGRATRRR